MTWRGPLLLLLCAGAALAQLPRSQAPAPRPGPSGPIRLEAAVTDLAGKAIPDLTAADFTLEIAGAPRPIDRAVFRRNQPLRLAVILDDLGLTLDQLNAARRALRAFVSGMKEGDEMAISRTSSGSGALDAFTSEKAALGRAIDRARFHPAAEERTAESFAAGALGVVRGVLDGMSAIEGRKGLLLISAGFGASPVGHRGSTVIYGFDAAPPAGAALEQGFAAAAKESGGRVFASGDAAAALARIAEEQRNYYVLSFGGSDLPFDFIARAPKAEKLSLRVSRPDTILRTRADIAAPVETGERDFAELIDADVGSDGVRVKLTGLLTMDTSWQIDVVVHVDAHDVTFVKGLDGIYRTTLDTSTALFDQNGKSVKEVTRSFTAQLKEEFFERHRTHGFGYTVTLPLAAGGSYQLRAVLRDAASGRVGSARQFLRVVDSKDGRLAMSSIVIRGEEDSTDPRESGSIRSFQVGRKVLYAYNLFNVGADGEKRSEIETKSEIWRDGVKVYNADARPVAFPPSETPGRRGVSGALAVSADMVPGTYVLRIEVTDKLTKRAASQTMDFEVRP
jgi:hypothetical protein